MRSGNAQRLNRASCQRRGPPTRVKRPSWLKWLTSRATTSKFTQWSVMAGDTPPCPPIPPTKQRFYPCRGKWSDGNWRRGGSQQVRCWGGACTVGTFTDDGVDLVENMRLLKEDESDWPPFPSPASAEISGWTRAWNWRRDHKKKPLVVLCFFFCFFLKQV